MMAILKLLFLLGASILMVLFVRKFNKKNAEAEESPSTTSSSVNENKAGPSAPPKKAGPAGDRHHIISKYHEYFITKTGSLIGAVVMEGVDPDGMSEVENQVLTAVIHSFNSILSHRVTVYEYYSHFDGSKFVFKDRNHPLINKLIKSRQDYLNAKNLKQTVLVKYFEIEPATNYTSPGMLDLFKMAYASITDKTARKWLRARFSVANAIVLRRDELDDQYDLLETVIDKYVGALSGVSSVRRLTDSETFGHIKFLATNNPLYYLLSKHIMVPKEQIQNYLAIGDMVSVSLNNTEVLKFKNTTPIYSRIASAYYFEVGIKPAIFASSRSAPTKIKGNFTIATRFTPLSPLRQQTMFSAKERELDQSTVNIIDILKGDENKANDVAQMRDSLKEKYKELEKSKDAGDVYGEYNCAFAVFDEDPDALKKTSKALDESLTNLGILYVWETLDLADAYSAYQPGGKDLCLRNLLFKTYQYSAVSLVHKTACGNDRVEFLNNEEPIVVLETEDGGTFGLDLFVNGKNFTLGIGPSGSGKTFFKNLLAENFLKYDNSMYRAIDVDAGTRILTQLLPEYGGYFGIGENDKGLNPFASMRGEDDVQFVNHLGSLLRLMRLANEEDSLRRLEDGEQAILDAAIYNVMKLPEEKRVLRYLLGAMPPNLAKKYARWIRDAQFGTPGRYGKLYDNSVDVVGNSLSRLGVYNLQEFKKDEGAMPVLMHDLIYRVSSVFEDPNLKHIPKLLDVDECHHGLSIPEFRTSLEAMLFTWRKYLSGLSMWTQSPGQISRYCEDVWDAMSGSIGTYIFMADPSMEKPESYVNLFNLTPAQLETIKTLEPMKEAIICQKSKGIFKKVIINTDKYTYAANTSVGTEAKMRDDLTEKFGVVKGLEVMSTLLDSKQSKPNSNNKEVRYAEA